MKSKLLFVFLLLLVLVSRTFSSVGIVIRGTVMDEKGVPVSGVSISISEKNEAKSDIKGKFQLEFFDPKRIDDRVTLYVYAKFMTVASIMDFNTGNEVKNQSSTTIPIGPGTDFIELYITMRKTAANRSSDGRENADPGKNNAEEPPKVDGGHSAEKETNSRQEGTTGIVDNKGVRKEVSQDNAQQKQQPNPIQEQDEASYNIIKYFTFPAFLLVSLVLFFWVATRVKNRNIARAVFFILAVSFTISITSFALIQRPHPDAYKPKGLWEKFLYPIERNAFQRWKYVGAILTKEGHTENSKGELNWKIENYRTVFKTTDGGKTWIKQTRIKCGVPSAFLSPNNATGWMVGYNGAVLKTTDRGESWDTKYSEIKPLLYDVWFFSDNMNGWVVGEKGALYKSTNGGETWVKYESGSEENFFSIYFLPDETNGWIVGDNGTIFNTTDGGKSWVKKESGTTSTLISVYFFPGKKTGWIVGEKEKIFKTTDGGETWVEKQSRAGIDFFSIHFLPDSNTGWITGERGAILKTTAGGDSWTKLESGSDRLLWSGHFSENGSFAWVAGQDGTILKTTDGGKTWQKKSIDTNLFIVKIQFSNDNQTGWSFAEDGSVFKSYDGGESWELLNTYKRYPASWYYLFMAIVIVSSFQLFRKKSTRQPKPKKGIEEILVSDKPLEHGEPDYLDFGPIADGISMFIRNRKTQPPLTLAITGKWGTGKSSLMNLIKHDLKKNNFYPVWFNAWHHQSEEQLLAALLENIRLQGIPPVWHLKGMWFRLKLFFVRFKRILPVLIPIMVAYALLLGFTWSNEFKLAGLVTVGEGLMVNSVLLFLALFKKLKPFSTDFNGIIKNIMGNFTIQDLKKNTGFRYKFAREFREVTDALSPRNLVILIDDLDRCKPGHVVNILESVNFLVSSGNCFIVMGLALERVKRCVGFEFKDVAGLMVDDLENRGRRKTDNAQVEEVMADEKLMAFADSYLKKLVNIEVPIPKSSDKQAKRMLMASSIVHEAEPDKKGLFKNFLAALYYKRHAVVSAVSIFFVLAGLFYFAYNLGEKLSAKAPAKSETERIERVNPPVKASLKTTSLPKDTTPGGTNTQDRQKPGNDLVYVEGEKSRFRYEFYLFVLAVCWFGIRWLVRRDKEEIPTDSEDFTKALAAWHPLIVARNHTPREVKGFQNRVRYYAMRCRVREKGMNLLEQWLIDWNIIGHVDDVPDQAGVFKDERDEQIIVTLAAIHNFMPIWIEDKTNWQAVKNALNKKTKLIEVTSGDEDDLEVFNASLLKDNADQLQYREITDDHREEFLYHTASNQ